MAQDCLAIFYYGAFLPVANGGNARLVDMLERLRGEFPRIILYTYADHPDFPWSPEGEAAFRARWPEIELVLERYGRLLRWATRWKNLVIALAPQPLAARVVAAGVPRATPRFDDVKRRSRAFLISYTEGLTQLNGVDPARCVVETHDLNFVKWAKMAGHRPVCWTALRKLRGEMTALAGVHAAVAISPGEAAFFRMMLPRPVHHVPRWSHAAVGSAAVATGADYDLVFVGSGYAMNVRGLCAMLDREGWWLKPYRVAICGHVADEAAVRAAAATHANVQLLGFVDDIADVYRRSRAVLAPVDGTGTKMKILDALAAGLPAFASAHAREGLPRGHEEAVLPLTRETVTSVLDAGPREAAARLAARRFNATLHEAGQGEAAIGALRDLLGPGTCP